MSAQDNLSPDQFPDYHKGAGWGDQQDYMAPVDEVAGWHSSDNSGDRMSDAIYNLPDTDRVSPDEFAKMRESVKHEGVREPIQAFYSEDDDGLPSVYDGHHRFAAARLEGVRKIPVHFA